MRCVFNLPLPPSAVGRPPLFRPSHSTVAAQDGEAAELDALPLQYVTRFTPGNRAMEASALLLTRFHGVYNRASYGLRLDYTQAPPPPPFAEADHIWIDDLLTRQVNV